MRILMIAIERVGPSMAAGGIRYAELARALAAHGEVMCMAPPGSEAVEAFPEVRVYDPDSPAALARPLEGADVVLAPPLAPRLAAGIVRAGRPWIVDVIDPEPFEGLEYHRGRPSWERRALAVVRLDRLSYALRRGSAFVCAAERQRDMWLGMLAAMRRLDPDRYDADPMLRGLIDVVPSGVDPRPPDPPATPVLRGVALPDDARIVLWNGGIWNWFDPDTAIEAVTSLHERDRRWRLVFMSSERPSARPAMAASRRVAGAACEAVHVNRTWVPYVERAGYLLEADVCVSTHRPTLESRFAFRNRLLDCLWVGLPIVCTEGDLFADLVAEHGWGAVVPAGDAGALASALQGTAEADRDAIAASMARYRERHTWAAAAAALDRLAGGLLDGSRRVRRLDATAALSRARHGVASALRRPR